MRELEEEEGLELELGRGTSKAFSNKVPEVVVVQDSQAEMKLGPDGTHESEAEAELAVKEQLDEHGNPRKVWKKKGLKRQTRRVISEFGSILHLALSYLPAFSAAHAEQAKAILRNESLG